MIFIVRTFQNFVTDFGKIQLLNILSKVENLTTFAARIMLRKIINLFRAVTSGGGVLIQTLKAAMLLYGNLSPH